MLPVPAAVASGIVLLSVHASLAEWDLEGLSTAWMRWIEKGFKKPDSQEQRMEDALQKMMMENYRRAIRYVAHFVGALVLFVLYRMQQQPDYVTAVQFVAVLGHYVCIWWVARSHLTFNTFRLLTVLSHVGHTVFIINTHFAEEADYNFFSVVSAAFHVCGAAVIHDPPVMIPCQAWVCAVEVACYFGLEGRRRSPPWHFLCGQAVVLALGCGVSIMVQEWARTCIKASFQSADANLSLEGFQRVLRGVCDANVLLDDSFHIVGDNTRLRRVLATPTDLQGVKFTDLLDQEGRAQFEKFVRMPCNASRNPEEREEQDKTCSIPPCLRVSLPSAYSRVGVDIFHVLVPRFLDAAGPLHLLAITEDPDTRLQPDATLGAIPEALCMYSDEDNDTVSTVAEQEAASSKSSLSSSMLCRVHPVPELRELTMLVDASTDQQDVMQVHAKFKRDKNLPNDIHSCMPCLQTMLRPSDWLSIRLHVAKFAHEQCQVGSPDTHELPPVMLRRLDDQNQFLAANTVNLAPCRGQEPSKKSSLVWVYVRDFVNDEAKSQVPQVLLQCNAFCDIFPRLLVAKGLQQEEPNLHPLAELQKSVPDELQRLHKEGFTVIYLPLSESRLVGAEKVGAAWFYTAVPALLSEVEGHLEAMDPATLLFMRGTGGKMSPQKQRLSFTRRRLRRIEFRGVVPSVQVSGSQMSLRAQAERQTMRTFEYYVGRRLTQSGSLESRMLDGGPSLEDA
ncbi:unnamed protein product [Symbiodinium microadriaticum]|nr:unnamed protein product [Symbiodinium microadriaticum]